MLKKKAVDMTQGPIWQQLAAYTTPLLVGELFQQFYTMVDSIIVGRFVGSGALAAIGVSETIVKVLVGFFNGMAAGFTIIIAKYFGAKDREKLDQIVNAVLQLALLLGIGMTAGGLVLIKPILKLVNTSENSFAQAEIYLTIYFWGILGFVLYNTASGILRAVGDVQTPLYCLLFSSVLNIILDLVLVLNFGMSVDGVAYATIFSQWSAAAVSLWVLLCRSSFFSIDPGRHRLNIHTAWTLLRMGIPTGIQKTITSASNVLVLSRIAFFGDGCMAGWVIYNKLDHILTVCAQSLGSALSTFVSQNLGARQYRRIRQGVRTTLIAGTKLFLGVAVLLILFRKPFVHIFSPDPETIYYAERFVLTITVFKLTQLLMNIFAATLRGTGRMTLVTVIMLSGIVAFRQLYLVIVTSVANIPWLVGLAYPAGWTFAGCGLLFVYLFKIRKEWKENL